MIHEGLFAPREQSPSLHPNVVDPHFRGECEMGEVNETEALRIDLLVSIPPTQPAHGHTSDILSSEFWSAISYARRRRSDQPEIEKDVKRFARDLALRYHRDRIRTHGDVRDLDASVQRLLELVRQEEDRTRHMAFLSWENVIFPVP